MAGKGTTADSYDGGKGQRLVFACQHGIRQVPESGWFSRKRYWKKASKRKDKKIERYQASKLSYTFTERNCTKIPIDPYGSYSNEVSHPIVVPAAWHNLTYISPSSNKLKLHSHNPTLPRCHTRILEPYPDASRNAGVSRCETPDVHI